MGGPGGRRSFWGTDRWRAVALLFLAAALNYADRAAFSAVLVPLRDELALTDGQMGLLGSAFLWSYAIGCPLAGLLSDRLSRRRLVILSLMSWSVVTALTGWAHDFTSLVVLRMALGFSECIYLPASSGLLSDLHGTETRGRAIGLHILGLNLGVVLGGGFAGYVAEHYGWRWSFWLLGALGIGLSWLCQHRLPRTAAPAPKADLAKVPRESAGVTLRALLSTPSYLAMLATAMLAGVAVWMFFNWLPTYFRERFHLSLAESGLAGTFVLQATAVAGLAVGGALSDRLARKGAVVRMRIFGVGYLVAAPGLLLFLGAPKLAVVVMAIGWFSFIRSVGAVNELPILCDLMPARRRAAAIGLFLAAATSAGGLGVLLAGQLKERFGLERVFAGCSATFLLAGLLLLLASWRWMPRDLARAKV